jgi:DNA invertase Pin-like site-specific DNA recombinase
MNRGENHHFAKITREQAEKIIHLLEQRDVARKLMEGLTYEKIARRFGVSRNAVYHISKKNSWKHLKRG